MRIMEEQGWDSSEISFGKNSGLPTFFKMFAERNLREFKDPSDRMRTYFSVPEKWPSKTTARAGEIRQVAKDKLIPILKELIDAYDKDYKTGSKR